MFIFMRLTDTKTIFICKLCQATNGFFYFLVLLAICLSSCTEDNLPNENATNDGIEFHFNLPQTRAIIDDNGSGSFEENDKIGLYIDDNEGPRQYCTLKMQNGRWIPLLNRKVLGTIRTLFTAFYPAPQTPVEEGYLWAYYTVAVDQSSEDGYRQSDVLAAQYDMVTSNNETSIPMTFRHQMHRLNITLTGLKTDATDFKIEVYGQIQGLFDISKEGSMQPVDDSPVAWITPRKIGDNTYSVLIAPQPVDIGKDRIRITCNGITYNYKFPNNTVGDSNNLESGKETDVKLHFSEQDGGAVDKNFAGKKLWLWGVEENGFLPVYDESTAIYAYPGNPEKFPVGKWFYIFPDDKSSGYLSWQQDYGWYDCDKYNPEAGEDRPGPKDGHMCWAASASNSLHWWMYHNRDYIELYELVYKADRDTMIFNRPSYEFTGELDDEVFAFFRNTCRNEGNFAPFGINWFITGRPGKNGSIPYLTEDAAYRFKGFFNRVFGSNDEIASFERPLTKEKFNRIIKDAFRNDCSLTFSVNSTGGHAMTVWGAEFDEQGIVSALYYVDNNDYYQFEVIGSSTPYRKHRCIRKAVRYQDDLYRPILLGSVGTVAITDIGQVDLRRDVWEKWKQSLNL